LPIARAALAPLSIRFKRLFAMSERAGPDHTLLGTTNETQAGLLPHRHRAQSRLAMEVDTRR
jgi:hypothetical protein